MRRLLAYLAGYIRDLFREGPPVVERISGPIYPTFAHQVGDKVIVYQPQMIDDGLPVDGIDVGPVNEGMGWCAGPPNPDPGHLILKHDRDGRLEDAEQDNIRLLAEQHARDVDRRMGDRLAGR